MGKLKDIRVQVEFGKEKVRCPLCNIVSDVIHRDPLNEHFGIRCKNCGTYYFDASLFDDFDDAEHIYLFSGYTNHYSPNGKGYEFYNADWVNKIIDNEKKLDNEDRKIAELIFYYEQKTKKLGERIPFDVYPAIAYCEDTADLFDVAHAAQNKGYLQLFDHDAVCLTEWGIRFSREERKSISKKIAMMQTGKDGLGYNIADKEVKLKRNDNLPIKIFITHSSEDKQYVLVLTKMLRDFGVPNDCIICTSDPKHKPPSGKNAFNWLKEQFLEYKLHMIFVLSENYYKSIACLNEMGAAWLLADRSDLLLLRGFRFCDLHSKGGVLDSDIQGTSADLGEADIRRWLLDIKKALMEEFNLEEPDELTWDDLRNEFITGIKKPPKIKNQNKNDNRKIVEDDFDFGDEDEIDDPLVKVIVNSGGSANFKVIMEKLGKSKQTVNRLLKKAIENKVIACEKNGINCTYRLIEK